MATFILIEAQTLSSNAASLSFTAIPQTYTDLILYASTRNVNAVEEWIQLGFNNSTSNYSDILLWNDAGTLNGAAPGDQPPLAGSLAQLNSTTNTWANNVFYIHNYANTSYGKSYTNMSAQCNTSSSYSYWGFHADKWADTSAITTINLKTRQSPTAAILAGSTFYLYGIKNY